MALTSGQAGDAPAFGPVMRDMPGETAAKAVVADRAHHDSIPADLAGSS